MAKKKPSFHSYLHQNHKTKTSFKAYVDISASAVQEHGQHELEEMKKTAVDDPESPPLHRGELIVNVTHGVLRFTPFRDNKQGAMGSLYCTNYRLIFMTMEKHQGVQAASYRNLLLRDEDISLCCINSLYQVSKRKKNKLSPGSGVGISHHVKVLEIHCKDFRIFTYSFKLKKQESKKMVNAILHHAFPARPELLFAYDFQGVTIPDAQQKLPFKFSLKPHWQAELQRLGVSGWDVMPINTGYRMCTSLPEYWAVPRQLTIAEINDAATKYSGNRPPIWSYTYSNGADLVRMSEMIPDAKQSNPQSHKIILDAIKCCNSSAQELWIVDLQTACPTVKEIQNCYDKLRDLCMPITVKEVEEKDSSWYSGVDSTRWFHLVSSCLYTANSVVSAMVGRCQSVVLSEVEGRDLVCVVSCLVQLMLDPHYRTLHGFQSLIQREWVALGHRFLDRCGHVRSNKDEECPVFLLFLDCVWQLCQQYPSSMQFSETYLICLWDSMFNPIFETFIFNNDRERSIAARHTHVYSTSTSGFAKMMSVWDWSKQFQEEDQALFYNPMYVAKMELDLQSVVVPESHSYTNFSDVNLTNTTVFEESALTESFSDTLSLKSFIGARNSNSFGRKIKEPVEYSPPLPAGVLRAITIHPSLKFWTQCYLRWLTPLQIIYGGAPTLYLQQCHLVEEIKNLQEQVKHLDASDRKSIAADPHANQLFSPTAYGLSSQKWRQTLTSSFPFSVPGNITGLSASQSLNIYLSQWGDRPISGQRYSTDDSMDELEESSAQTASEHETKLFV